MNLTVSGPADKLVISGPIKLSGAKLAGFSMKSKLGALGSIPGLGGGSSGGGGSDTEIQTLSANVRNDPSGTKIDNLNLVMPSLGTITGNGTVSAAGQLNFKLVANLAGAAGALTSVAGAAGGGVTGALSSLTGGGGGSHGSTNGIPIIVQGTTSNPVVLPDASGMAKSALTNSVAGSPTSKANVASGLVGGLMGKKKTPQ
jgi:hypothetical protein